MRICSALLAIAMAAFAVWPASAAPTRSWWIAEDPTQPGEPFLFGRSHGVQAAFHLIWGLQGLRSMNRALLAALVAGVVLLAWLPLREADGPRANPPRLSARPLAATGRLRWVAIPGLALIAFLAFFALRVSPARNALFGDGPTLPAEVEGGQVFAAEVLTLHLFDFVHALGGWTSFDWSGQLSIALSSCLSGAIFVAGMALFADAMGRTPGEKAIFFVGPGLSGCIAQFFGYVETTCLVLSFMALHFGCVAQLVQGRPGPGLRHWQRAALATAGLACMAHAAGVLLLPSLLVVLSHAGGGESPAAGRAARRRAKLGLLWWTLLLIVVPYYLVVVAPFYQHGDFGNILGGGDLIQLVPLTLDYAHRPSTLVNYSLLSAWHLTDVLSAALVAAPLAIPLLLASRGGAARDRADEDVVWSLGLTAYGCTLVPLFWNHDFGMWGDWNLATAYLFPLHAFAWTAFLVRFRSLLPRLEFRLRALAPVLLVQLLGLFGILLQLYDLGGVDSGLR